MHSHAEARRHIVVHRDKPEWHRGNGTHHNDSANHSQQRHQTRESNAGE